MSKYDIRVYVRNQLKISFGSVEASSFLDIYSKLISRRLNSRIDYKWLCCKKARVIVFLLGVPQVNYYFDSLHDKEEGEKCYVDVF